MTSTNELIAALELSHAGLHEALRGISEEDAARKSDPDCWSVRDCVEHLALSERGMLNRIASATPGEAELAAADRKPAIAAALGNRGNKLQAPSHVQPTGRFGTLAESIAQFDAARREAIRFAEENAANLAARTAQHPLFGPVTGPEMLTIMAGHARRHTEQIRQIRTCVE